MFRKQKAKGWIVKRANWQGELTGQADRTSWQVKLTGQTDRPNWQAKLVGQTNRPTDRANWQDKLSGQTDRSNWQGKLSGQTDRAIWQGKLTGQIDTAKCQGKLTEQSDRANWQGNFCNQSHCLFIFLGWWGDDRAEFGGDLTSVSIQDPIANKLKGCLWIERWSHQHTRSCTRSCFMFGYSDSWYSINLTGVVLS